MLLGCLIVVLIYNITQVSNFLTVQNQINLLSSSAVESSDRRADHDVRDQSAIDLSVASMMGAGFAAIATMHDSGWNMPWRLRSRCWSALRRHDERILRRESGNQLLAVTLAGYIGFRGLALALIEDKSLRFPALVRADGTGGIVGPITFSIMVFFVMAAIATVILHFSGFGRRVYTIGSNARVAVFSGFRWCAPASSLP
ncbi:MAG: hypothetical protein R2855_04625 [Thermomicrobiales bacterium]